jgi:hsp70-interacting protein
VRKKSILALSSGVRNYQPAFDQWVEALPADLKPSSTDAEDMDAIDTIINKLREDSKNKA